MSTAYKNIQKGMIARYNLSKGRRILERLEEICFYLQRVDHDEAFEKRCRELIAFIEEFGHCNVPRRCANYPRRCANYPRRCANYPSFGGWCNDMIIAYKTIQKGEKSSNNLSQDRIERLKGIGCQWKV